MGLDVPRGGRRLWALLTASALIGLLAASAGAIAVTNANPCVGDAIICDTSPSHPTLELAVTSAAMAAAACCAALLAVWALRRRVHPVRVVVAALATVVLAGWAEILALFIWWDYHITDRGLPALFGGVAVGFILPFGALGFGRLIRGKARMLMSGHDGVGDASAPPEDGRMPDRRPHLPAAPDG